MDLHTKTHSTLLEALVDPSDRSAWQEFDLRYRPLVLAVARRLGLMEMDAEDAAQDTMTAFVQAYRNKRYDREKGRLRDWIQGIAVNKIRDIQRKRIRKEKPLPEGMEEPASENDAGALWDEEWEKAVLRQCIEEVRREVSPKTFEAFQLFSLEQWPAKRVAAHLAISEDVVYQSKSRILARIQKILPRMQKIW